MARTKTTPRKSAKLKPYAKKDAFTQTEHIVGSYNRRNDGKESDMMTYEQLRAQILTDHGTLFQWCVDHNLIASKRICTDCGKYMQLKPAKEGRSDRWLWRCRKRVGEGKEIIKEASIREGSLFEGSNLTIAEILQFIYWWSIGMTQTQITAQMRMSSSTSCSWHSKCREICEFLVMQHPQKIGGPGKVVQIDESKIGKRKYNKGHPVEGQWVFGGIEEESRGSFLVCVETRSEEVLLPIIKQWILPGTLIVSDGWKAYCNLSKHGYQHSIVNHSKEWKNSDNQTTNKIEGHWRQMKVSLPSHGRVKKHYPEYLGEFQYRYRYKEEDLFLQFISDLPTAYPVHKFLW